VPQHSPDSPFTNYTNSKGLRITVRKSTLCWLYGGGEKLSADRRLRVQESGEKQRAMDAPATAIQRNTSVALLQWCAFRVPEGVDGVLVGRVMSFRYLTGRTEHERQYSLDSAPVAVPAGKSARGLGCLCTWFSMEPTGELRYETAQHRFVPVESYVCTLPVPKCRNASHFYYDIDLVRMFQSFM
jgi:hypothetical protein